MHKEGKVVPLAAAIDRGTRTPSPSLPVLLLQVRDKAALQLRQGLQALFDNADDTLFEMADKAAARVDQNLYFEAMRDLRLKRKSIERGFLDLFYEAFARIGQADLFDSLVPRVPDQAEQARSVALQAMVDRVLSRDGFFLQQLNQRFAVLLGRVLDERQNPLGPGSLCDYFLAAGRSLGVGTNVKMVLLKLFERYVLRDLDQLYGEAGQLLASAGVLPDLQPAPRRRAEDLRDIARRVPSNAVQAGEAGADAAGQAFFASVQGLLAPYRGDIAPRLQAVGSAQPIGTGDLLRLLTHLQHYVPAAGEPDDFNLGQQLEQLLLRVSVRSGTRRRIASDDEDMINLVGLLFGHIEVDDNLPESLRGLIGRLHIPLLKVALIDKALFCRATHPARRLLNEIATTAIGWEGDADGVRDSLHLRVERIVQRLLNDFSEDCGLFGELLEEFLTFSQEERRRNDVLEQRTRDTEEGRARTLQARQRVQRELNLRLRGRTLPEGVLRMLEQSWSQVLLLAWLKQGEASTAWAEGLATVDTLLASIAPHAEPSQLLEQVPGLLKALREGLAGVALDSAATREFFLQLEQLHLRACAGLADDTAERLVEVRVEDEIVLAIADEPIGGPRPWLNEQEPTLRQVQRLRIGTWVEVLDDDEPLRCKLVARVDINDRFVFANRTGMKVREWNRAGLAMALRLGEVRLLDDGLLFERALEAVLEDLRRQQGH